MDRELQTFLEEHLETRKITAKTFLAEKKGVQASSRAWHTAMQSEHVQRMAFAHAMTKQIFLDRNVRLGLTGHL